MTTRFDAQNIKPVILFMSYAFSAFILPLYYEVRSITSLS